jgi:hypothetical protein
MSIHTWGVITNETGSATTPMARIIFYAGTQITSASAASFGRIIGFGVLECNGSGSIIPSVQISAGSSGSKTRKNSVFTLIPLGPNSSSHNEPL